MTRNLVVPLCAAGLLFPLGAVAQRRSAPRSGQVRTSLRFELVTRPNTLNSLAAQEWGRVFSKLGHSVRIRGSQATDADAATSVTESQSGGFRVVRAVGVLDREGRIHFGTVSFGRRETVRLTQWIRDLERYGAAGDPKGQPLWGLDAKQFDEVFDALSTRGDAEVKGQSLQEAVKTLALPDTYPLRWDKAARDWLSNQPPDRVTVTRELRGYSRATALAIILNDAGLGFFPERQPDGRIQLAIERRADRPLWPVGWEPKLSPYKTAPALFKQINIQDVDNIRIAQLFDVVATRSGVPVLLDEFVIRQKGKDPDGMRITFAPKRLSWNRILQSAAIKNHLSYAVRIDELGMPFVWISTPEVARARKERFPPE